MPGTNRTAKELLDKYIAGETFYCFLLTANTTGWQDPAVERDMALMSAIAADEASDASYARVALSGLVTSQDDVNDRGELTAGNITFPSLAAAVGEIIGVGFERRVTDDTDSVLKGAIDVSAVGTAEERTPDGGDFLVKIGSEGLVHVRTAA